MKTIKVEVPFALWEAFRKAYPRRGEGTEILRRVISLLVESKDKKDMFATLIANLVNNCNRGAEEEEI